MLREGLATVTRPFVTPRRPGTPGSLRPGKPFPPTVRAVPEVVPQKSIPRLNLTVPPQA
jgi:hypothetical protein